LKRLIPLYRQTTSSAAPDALSDKKLRQTNIAAAVGATGSAGPTLLLAMLRGQLFHAIPSEANWMKLPHAPVSLNEGQ
jgi:hypothetical protein